MMDYATTCAWGDHPLTRRDGYIEVYAPSLGRIVRICQPCVRGTDERRLADALGVALPKREAARG